MDGKSARRPASGRKREPSQAESTHPSVRQSVKRERIQCIRLTGWISVKDKMSCDATFRLAPRAPPGPLPEKWPAYEAFFPSLDARQCRLAPEKAHHSGPVSQRATSSAGPAYGRLPAIGPRKASPQIDFCPARQRTRSPRKSSPFLPIRKKSIYINYLQIIANALVEIFFSRMPSPFARGSTSLVMRSHPEKSHL